MLSSFQHHIFIEKNGAAMQHRLYARESDGALNLVGTEASRTDVDMARRTIDDGLNTLYVGLPGTVGTSVGVRNLNTERYTLAANITLCQLLHLQSWKNHAF